MYRLYEGLTPPIQPLPLHCDIGDDFRPSIGCLPSMALGGPNGVPRPASRVLGVTLALPPGTPGTLLIVEPKVRGGAREEWRRTPTMLVDRPRDGNQLELSLPLPDQVKGDKIDAEVIGMLVPPNRQERVSQPLAIGRGAKLTVALGLHPLAAKLGAAPVSFRLTAETGDVELTLIDEVLVPGDSKGWQERSIDLAPLKGERVRFRFRDRGRRDRGARRARSACRSGAGRRCSSRARATGGATSS